MKALMILCLSIVVLSNCYQKQEVHWIDKQRAACLEMDTNQTTAGMIECEMGAAASWELEMQRTYDELMGTLPPNQQEKLNDSQLAWIAYSEKELAFATDLYWSMGGTMRGILITNKKGELIRSRTLELHEYID